jgi:hypothetical protein
MNVLTGFCLLSQMGGSTGARWHGNGKNYIHSVEGNFE